MLDIESTVPIVQMTGEPRTCKGSQALSSACGVPFEALQAADHCCSSTFVCYHLGFVFRRC